MSHPLPPGIGPVEEVHRTHLSEVFLTADLAIKTKRPVDVGFADFTDREARRAACEAELRLNRRLAPDVYLRVEDLPDGEPAVIMRRLDPRDSLDARLHAGTLTEADVARVAGTLATFHRGAGNAAAQTYAAPEVVRANVLGNFDQSLAQIGPIVHADVHARGRAAAEQALTEVGPRLAERVDRAVDGHGDLRLEHVFLHGEQVVVIDCVEFSDAFRCGDPLSDIAFLAMDLEIRGAPHLAAALLEAWFRSTGDDSRDLLPFYLSYRSLVRGKVRGMQAADPANTRALALARRHWCYGVARLLPPAERPVLVGVGGLPGTGKSTLARALGERGFRVIRSDVVRKELAGLAPDQGAAAPFGQGLYTDDARDRVYDRCLARAEEALFAGERVVIDASFTREVWRARLREAAFRWGVPGVVLRCVAPEEVVLARITARRGDASDADAAIYRATTWEESEGVVPLDTGGPPPLDAALAAISAAWGP